MITKRSGQFFNVGMLISLFCQMGCELRLSEGSVETTDGDDFKARYLYNPETGDFVSLTDLSDDEAISKWEIASWERRLGMKVPLPD